MAIQDIEEGQIVLCTVDRIAGTTVFVKIEDNGEGTITMSEISPGRIRNIREFVVPGKKIVCQILKIRNEGIQLSLRRVKPNQRKELLEKIAKEKSYRAIIKTIIGVPEWEKVTTKITEEYSIIDFFEKIKKEPKILDNYFNKEDSEKILKILDSKKEKEKEIKQIFRLSNKNSNGSVIVKDIIQGSCNGTSCSVNYLAAGKFSIIQKGEAFKKVKGEMNNVLTDIEKKAKKSGSEFTIEKS